MIVLASLDGSSTVTQVSDSYYFANMITVSLALGLVVCMAGVFAYRMYSALARGGRTWRKRQPYLIRDAVVVSTLTTVDLCCVVTSYALYVAAECFPSETALVVLSFVRRLTFTATVAWMTTTATLMQLVNGDQDGHGEDGEHQMGRDRGVTGSQGPGNAQVDASTTSVTVRTADACRVGHTRNVRLLVDEPVSVILRKRYVWILFVNRGGVGDRTSAVAALVFNIIEIFAAILWRCFVRSPGRQRPCPSCLTDHRSPSLTISHHLSSSLIISHQLSSTLSIVDHR